MSIRLGPPWCGPAVGADGLREVAGRVPSQRVFARAGDAAAWESQASGENVVGTRSWSQRLRGNESRVSVPPRAAGAPARPKSVSGPTLRVGRITLPKP